MQLYLMNAMSILSPGSFASHPTLWSNVCNCPYTVRCLAQVHCPTSGSRLEQWRHWPSLTSQIMCVSRLCMTHSRHTCLRAKLQLCMQPCACLRYALQGSMRPLHPDASMSLVCSCQCVSMPSITDDSSGHSSADQCMCIAGAYRHTSSLEQVCSASPPLQESTAYM